MTFVRAAAWVVIAGLSLRAEHCPAQGSVAAQQQIGEHRAKVQQYLREKKPDLAISELKALLELDPSDTDSLANLGVLLFFKGDCSGAIPLWKSAVSQRDDLWRIRVLLGICERRQNDPAEARADLEAAFPHLDEAKLRLEGGMELANLYVSAGDLDKAAPVVDKLRAENPTDPRILYMAYRVHSDLAGEAMVTLSLADPNSPQMHQIMAREKQRYGDQAGAIAQLRIAVQGEPNSSTLHFELAEALSGSNAQADRNEAEREYRLALELDPSNERAERKLGDIEQEHEHVKEAYAHYAHAVQLVPTDLDAKLGLAMTLLQMEHRDEAKALIEDVLRSEPENAMAHFFLSKVYWREGRKEDAQKEVELYKKYKEMKEKMRAIYRELRLSPQNAGSADSGETGNAAAAGPKK